MPGIANLRAVLAPNPSPMTLDGTRTYLVGWERPVIIDPGPADNSHVDRILEELSGAQPAAILLTHAHHDHAGASAVLAARTGAPVMLARGDVGATLAIPIGHRLADGDEVESDAGPLRAIATPGHCPEHLAFHWHGPAAPRGSVVFVGDLMMGEGDTTLVAPPEGDLADYLRSLRRIRELDAAVLIPTHGPPIHDPGAAIERYLAHRRDRVRQVSAAMDARKPTAPVELVRRVYGPDLDPALAEAAEGSVRAILRFLEKSVDDDV